MIFSLFFALKLLLLTMSLSFGKLIITGVPTEEIPQCRGAEHDLREARIRRDELRFYTGLTEDQVATGKDYPQKIAEASKRLKYLFSRCHVPSARLGFGPRGEESVNFITRRAYRNVLTHKEALVARTHYAQSDEKVARDLKDIAFLQKETGLREALNERNTRKLETVVSERRKTSLASAQAASSEKSCTKKDFRSQLPPIRDQAGAGFCGSYTAADLLSFKMGKNISPLGVAIASAKEKNHSGMIEKLNKWHLTGQAPYSQELQFDEGTNPFSAYQAAVKNGICLDSQFGASTREASNPFGKMGQPIPAEERNLAYSTLDELELLASKKDTAEKMAGIEKISDRKSCSAYGEALKRLFPSADLTDISRVIQSSGKVDAIYNFYDQVCAKSGLSTTTQVERLSRTAGSLEITADIDRELDRGNIVAVTYYAGFFDSLNKKPSGYHASTVVGRQFNQETGVCEYLIRNSWGADCSGYNTDGSNALKCDHGNIWVPEDVLRNSTRQIVRFK